MSAAHISIIIEWENILLADNMRSQRMLDALGRQVAEMPLACEVLVIFNPTAIQRESLETLLGQYFQPTFPGPASLRIVAADTDLHYYDLKNFGARQAHGEIIVFMDSDVVPEPGWLSALIQPLLDDPSICVIGGNTYLDAQDLVGKAFALSWFFPFRLDQPALYRSGHFFANNVAFRRDLFLRHSFPAMPDGATRGACTALAKNLSEQGIAIWSTNSAHAAHPAPHGWRHLMIRGLAEGRDWTFYARLDAGHQPARTILQPLYQVGSRTIRTARRAWSLGDKVGLRRWEILPAVAIMGLYAMAFCLGAWCALIAPGRVRHRWQI